MGMEGVADTTPRPFLAARLSSLSVLFHEEVEPRLVAMETPPAVAMVTVGGSRELSRKGISSSSLDSQSDSWKEGRGSWGSCEGRGWGGWGGVGLWREEAVEEEEEESLAAVDSGV